MQGGSTDLRQTILLIRSRVVSPFSDSDSKIDVSSGNFSHELEEVLGLAFGVLGTKNKGFLGPEKKNLK